MGDELQDLREIYDSNAPRIFRYVYHRLGNQDLAEDLTSEVFVRFLHARVSPDNVTAFLYRMAHNLIVDHLRRHRPVLQLDDRIPAERGDPLRLAEIEMERTRIRRALARLTPEQEQVIVLKFLEGLSNEEIAQILGKDVGAVKSLQHRGLAALRGLLSQEMPRDRQVKETGRSK